MRILAVGAGERPVSLSRKCRGLPDLCPHDEIYNTDKKVFDLNDKRSVYWKHVRTYDFIVAEHIIEHVRERFEVLKGLGKMLKPGGVLVVEVPNFYHISAHGNLEHRWTFSRWSFDSCYYSEELGLRKIKAEYRLSKTLNFYLGGFLGRLADRLHLATAVRFYLRRVDGNRTP